ncbi:MAG: glutamine synthetase type III, partial [Eubacteriales bacterium]|nr:glutamine synthetase type III [Eubacteriales bacterium]
GSELSEILEAIEQEKPYDSKGKDLLRIGVHTLPKFSKDSTDRNRTSPFAFTGNKFEFRMLGSASSISCTNTVLNTSVAEVLRQFADILEQAEDFEKALNELIKSVIVKHKRIIFNGDGYDDAWVTEAEKRGLLNLKSTPDALAHMLDEKNINLFECHRVYSKTELVARHEVQLENYCKTINIEALTMLDMARKDIMPAMSEFAKDLANAALDKLHLMPDVDCSYEKENIKSIAAMLGAMNKQVKKLESDLLASKSIDDLASLADFYKLTILDDMKDLRILADGMETIASSEKWPYPSYGELLFGVR